MYGKGKILDALRAKGPAGPDTGEATKAKIISRLLEMAPAAASDRNIIEILGILRSLQGKDICIYRNLDLIDLVVDCAVRPHPIQCYGSDFDPRKIGTITVGTDTYPNPQWLIAALTHINEPNMQILLSRVNARLDRKFLSTRSLGAAVGASVVFVNVSPESRSITLRDYSGHQANLSVEDLLKPENAGLLQELRSLC